MPATKRQTRRPLKQKRCRSEDCGAWFTPRNSLTTACSYPCALKIVEQKNRKKHRVETREMKRKFNETDRSYQLKRTQAMFNKYILKRDEKDGCIACGIRTGQMHASHFYSVGHAPELRFHPDNCHKGCAQCNTYKSGNIPAYQINLEKKIGRDRVENLAQCRTPQNLTLDDIKDIHDWYRDLHKLLQEAEQERSI